MSHDEWDPAPGERPPGRSQAASGATPRGDSPKVFSDDPTMRVLRAVVGMVVCLVLAIIAFTNSYRVVFGLGVLALGLLYAATELTALDIVSKRTPGRRRNGQAVEALGSAMVVVRGFAQSAAGRVSSARAARSQSGPGRPQQQLGQAPQQYQQFGQTQQYGQAQQFGQQQFGQSQRFDPNRQFSPQPPQPGQPPRQQPQQFGQGQTHHSGGYQQFTPQQHPQQQRPNPQPPQKPHPQNPQPPQYPPPHRQSEPPRGDDSGW